MKLTMISEKEKNGRIARDYEIGAYSVHEVIGEDWRNIDVRYIDRIKAQDEFRPEIYFENSLFGEEKEEFKIQTTAYGLLDLEDYKTFIKSCAEAFEVAKTLAEELLQK